MNTLSDERIQQIAEKVMSCDELREESKIRLAVRAAIAEERELMQASQWIPVEERLPESNSDVWRYSPEEGVIRCFFATKGFLSDEEKLTTHWQYRVKPEPPK